MRAVWDEVNSKWWFSVLDIVAVLTDQDDYNKTRNYWKYLKTKLRKENNELVSATNQLKLLANDGKRYLTRLIPPSGILNIHVLYYSLKLNIPVSFITTNKHLYILNFDKGVLYKLDEDNTLLSTINIDEVFKEDFNYSDIIFNKEFDKCFVRYDNSSISILKELDLNTGEYIRTIKIPQNRIEKIRIVKDYIYYTVPVEGANAMERQLFKLRINDELTQK